MPMTQQPGDVWAQATYQRPALPIATGAAECRCCPVCRAIAAARASRSGVAEQVMDAGQWLYTVVQDALSGLERSRPDSAPPRERATPTPPRARWERSGPGGDHGDGG
jgi:hypothetical protein